MIQKFTIQGRLPNLNDFIAANRTNPYKGNKLKRDSQNIVIAHIRQAKLKPIHSRVRLKYTFYEPNTRRDMDNVSSFFKKICQDALVETKILENDGWKNIAGSEEEFYVDKINPRIEIEIEIIEEN